MKNLPIFDAVISDEDDGIFAISLVHSPAIEARWLLLSEEERLETATPREVQLEADDERYILTGPVLIPDKLIYRRRGEEEYYIKFSAEEIEKICKKALMNGTLMRNDVQHSGQMVDGVELLEVYLKDDHKGLQFDVPNGSLIVSYHISNPDIWEKAKKGDIQGFSLAGCFDMVEEQMNICDSLEDEEAELSSILSMLRKVKNIKM